ncbi:hypothetical protein LPJ61_002261 [Coemansia biformis]|uniref:AAA-ATPase-like domain-containing protein n=1 Tax=Coemansia biformis TaxID=1286918 RepID=A0A9W8CWL0_9FUNG|nr:hypothetical protein LPJ61_002261 [Coemansia biformis]
MSASSPSKVRGQTVTAGDSGWSLISDDEAMVVDKSVAIYDIMRKGCSSVIAGLYPRRMGKTTFLDLLKNFLAVVSNTPYGERRTKYERFAIYVHQRAFFDEHFGRYAVFKLDLKDDKPETRDEAAERLRKAVVDATADHIDFLRSLLAGGEDVDVGAYDRSIIAEKARRYERDITVIIDSFEFLEGLKETKAIRLTRIGALLPELMKVFFRLFGRKSVLIVDEYDAPFVKTFCRVADVDLRNDIHATYSEFLSGCLKSNDYLEKGVLVGVFDVKCAGMGSGLNNVQYYLAHTGIADAGETGHPFQRAFGFTGQDVGCLVDHYVDTTWKPRPDDDDHAITKFKAHLFAGFLRHFDGYRIGNVPRIFCPYAVMKFVQTLGSVREPEKLRFEGFRFWAETGNLQMIDAIMTDSTTDLESYVSNLTVLFHWRCGNQPSVGELVEMHAADTFNDDSIDNMIREQPPPHPFQGEGTIGAEIARICMVEPSSLSDELATGKHLSARTAIQLLYQAGYLAPVAAGEVAIPSMEVLQDFSRLYEHIARKFRLRTRIAATYVDALGITDGNMGMFAGTIRVMYHEIPEQSENTPEKDCQIRFGLFLGPARLHGYTIDFEFATGNGRSDVQVHPLHGNPPGNAATSQRPNIHYVFELKSYDGPLRRNRVRMTENNRRRVAKRAWKQSKDALAQVYDLYHHSITEKARGCDYLFIVGLTFWVNRFCMISTRRRRTVEANGDITWPVDSSAGDGNNVVNRDGTIALDYTDLEDVLGDPEQNILRTYEYGATFVALNI